MNQERSVIWLNTGQTGCYDEHGAEIPCRGSGLDAEYRTGKAWPEPRFEVSGHLVTDRLTGLVWPKDANVGEFPLTWQESLDFIKNCNREGFLGFNDWRLPNRRELRSLMSYQDVEPSLPENHPFVNVFHNWYWTSTSAALNPAYAWYVHMLGARMFYGRKNQYCLFWPVRGKGNGVLAVTGQSRCFATDGEEISCADTGQDGELRMGATWPQPRFAADQATVVDRLSKLRWLRNADMTGKTLTWSQSLKRVEALNKEKFAGFDQWRLPNINEMESLVDCSQHNPALSAGHPFKNVREAYWSSTTSLFETDWAWVLYLHKGACGVGFKAGITFHAWPVCSL